MNEYYKQVPILKKLYSKGENIIDYLKNQDASSFNSMDSILVSYDLQSGSYIDFYNNNQEAKERYLECIGDTLNDLDVLTSLLEVGVGEATTIANLIKYLNHQPEDIFGFDLSWSRIKYAREYCKFRGLGNIKLATGDLFHPPFEENSIDVVYTSHTIEPNGGREKEAIKALYKITKNYLVLFEPFYEFASDKIKVRMRKNGYITGLKNVIEELGYNIVKYGLLNFSSDGLNPEKSQNPTGVIIIKKNVDTSFSSKPSFSCPYSQKPLSFEKNYYLGKENLIAYPIIDEIPCLNPDNAILTTHHNTTIDGIFK